MKQLTIRKIKEEVKMHLDQNRYEHTLGVMYTAGALAMRYGADLEDTMIAGLYMIVRNVFHLLKK